MAKPTANYSAIFIDLSGQEDCFGLHQRAGISVAVSAPAGLATVKLWAQGPGETAYTPVVVSMFDHGATWSTSVTAGQLHAHAGGVASYYAIATDKNGVSKQSPSNSVTITPCDTDATINGGIDMEN